MLWSLFNQDSGVTSAKHIVILQKDILDNKNRWNYVINTKENNGNEGMYLGSMNHSNALFEIES